MAKILYIDDDNEITSMVDKVLTGEEHSVTVFNQGPAGWNNLKSNQYDLVILDWDMPDLNGIEILKLFRSTGDSTPVIMMTGRSSVEDKVQGLDCGATDYVPKPFHPKELIARVRAVLRAKAAATPIHKALGDNNDQVLAQANLAGTALAARFEFIDILGEGGVAIVFKARHPLLNKLVAIKMLQSSELSNEAAARFEQEARVISNLEHPNIVTVYDFGVTERRQPFMVMELLDGPNLHTILRERKYLPLEQALPLLLALSSGFAYAHDQGVLHRDIKPGNIVLRQAENRPPLPKILDFGLAKLLQSSNQKAAIHTQAQQICGSPAYMSPEQVRTKPLDERSDIYSFGCVMFEVVTGYPAFIGENPMDIALSHLEDPPLSFAAVRPDLKFPQGLEFLILKALEKDPDKRFKSMHELHRELEKYSMKLADTSIWRRLKNLKFF